MSFMHFIFGLVIAYAVSEILSRFFVHFVPRPHRPKWTETLRYHRPFLGRQSDVEVLVQCQECSATATISPKEVGDNLKKWSQKP